MALGGTIKLQGESEYRRALSQITQNLREVSSEMKIVTSTYDKSDTSTDALTAKSDVLNKRLEEQKSKLKLVSDQYKKYQDAVKQSADEHTQLGEKLENAKQKLASIEAQCGKNSKEYEDQKKAVDELQKEYDESTKAQDTNAKSLSQLAVKMNNAQADVIKTTKEIDNLGKESDDSAKQVDDLSKKMSDADGASKNLNDGFTVLKGTMANLASQAISKVVDGFKGLVSGAVDYQKSMEYYTTSFTVMTGSADKAGETVKKLADIGAKTPFDMPQLADATSLLMNFGFGADDAVDSMMMLGDISQGNADKLNSIARAYGKMNSAQKVSLEDINMMIDAGFNPLQEISEKTGESMKSLYDRVSHGKMSVDEITASMKRSTSEGGKYFKSMDAQSQTLDGRLSTLSDTVNSKLGEALQPVLKKAADEWIPDITNAIDNIDMDSVISVIDDLISGVGDLFGFIMDNGDMIISLVAGIGTAMLTWKVASMINGVVTAVKAFQTANEGASVAQALLNGVMNANPIMLVATLLAGLIATIVTLWNTNDGFRETVTNVWNAFKDTVGGAIESVGEFIANLVTWFSELPGKIGGFLGDVISSVANWASSMVQKAIEAGSNFITNIINFFSQLPYNIGYLIGEALGFVIKWVPQIASMAIQAGSQFLHNVVSFFSQLPSNIWNFLTTVISNVGSWVVNMAGKARQAGSQFLQNVISFFRQLPSNVARFLSNVISNLGSWAGNMARKGAEGARNLFHAVVNGIKNLPKEVMNIGKNIVQGIWDGISGAAGWLAGKVKSFAKGILDGMKNALKIHSPSRVFRDEVGKYIAEGIGVGFTNEMKSVTADMINAIPTNFDVDANVKGSSGYVSSDGYSYDRLVSAFKDALSQVKIEMDDEEMGHFVDKTVTKLIYT